MTELTYYIAIIGAAYLIGAIPSGAWIAYYKGINDITEHGSGNIGATNVARVLGIHYFFIVFLIDALKAYSCLWLISYYTGDTLLKLLCAIALLVGNGFSIFCKGKGGKGIATGAGILIAINYFLFCWLLALWSIALVITRNVGIASAMALLMIPVFSLYLLPGHPGFQLFALFICLWGLWRHADNIKTYFNLQEHIH